jgi:hypothetical protein
MKKMLFYAAAMLIVVTGMFSCNKNTPEASAEKFLNGFLHMDFEAAKSVSTEETKKFVSMMQQLSPAMVNDSVKNEAKKIKVKIIDSEIKGDKAVVTFTTSESNAQQKLHLVKENGNWLVESTKNDQFDMESEPMTEPDVPATIDTPALPADVPAEN